MNDTLDLELNTLAHLKEALADALRDDPDFLLDAAESETGLMELIDAMAVADVYDKHLIEGASEAAKSITERRDRIKDRREFRRALIERALMMLERDKLERPAATLSLAKRAPKLLVTEETDIPAAYFVTETVVKLDTKKLTEDLREGKTIPGATLDNGGRTLTVRVK